MSTEEVVLEDNKEEEQTTSQEEEVVETSPTVDQQEASEEKAEEEVSEAEQIQKEITDAQNAEKEVKESLTNKGIDFEKCAEEYMEKGGLSEDTYKALAEAGYTRNVVDAYIAGVEAKAEKLSNTILNSIGGKEEYDRIASFIQSQGNAAVDAYNALIESGNISAITMYLHGCKAQMTLKQGTANRSILGNQMNSNVQGYADETEMVKAMTDPRYKSDPQYAKQVALKLEKSSFVKYGR